MSYNLGTAQGNIRIEYDSRGVARARNDLGQFVSLSELFGDQVDRDSDRAGRSWASFAGTLAKSVAVILAAGAAANVLHGAILGVVAVAQSFIPIITASLATLPGVLLGAAAAAGVLKLAMVGVGDAIKAAFAQDAAKFEEAIKKLAPEAQNAAKALYAVGAAAKPVQQAVQNAFFAATAPLVQALVPALTGLTPLLTQVATGFNGIVKQLLGFAGSPVFIDAVSKALAGVAEFLTQLGPGFTPLLNGFAQLAGQAGKFFASFGDSAAQAMGRFGEFLGQLNLQDMWATAGAAIQNLGELFSSLGQIIGAVVRAFTGAGQGMDDLNSSTQPLANGLGIVVSKLAEFFNSAQGTTILNALAMAMQSVATVGGDVLMSLLSALAPIFAELGPLIQSLARAIGPILGAAFAALSPMLTTVANALRTGLGPALPGIVEAFTSLAPIIGRVAAVVGGVLGPLLQGLGPVIGQLAETLSGVLGAALTALLPSLEEYQATFSELAQKMFPVLIPLIQQLGNAFIALMPAITQMATNLLPLLVDAMVAFSPAIMGAIQVLTFLIGVFATVAGWIVQIVTKFNLLGAIIGIVSAVVRGIGALFQWLYDFLIGNSIIPDLVNGMLSWFRMGVAGAIAIWSAITGALSAIWNTILSIAQSIWNGVVSAVRNAVNNARAALQGLAAIPGIVGGFFRSMVSAVQSAIGSLLGVVRAVPGQVRGALGNLGGMLVGAGQDLIQGLINGIRNMAGAAISAARSIASSAASAVKGALGISSPSKVAIELGQFFGEGLGIGIMDMLRYVKAASDKLANSAAVQMAGNFQANAAANGQALVNGAFGMNSTTPPVPAAVAPSAGITVNQTVNALPGQSAKQVGDSAVQRLVFGVVTGTSGLSATASAPGVA